MSGPVRAAMSSGDSVLPRRTPAEAPIRPRYGCPGTGCETCSGLPVYGGPRNTGSYWASREWLMRKHSVAKRAASRCERCGVHAQRFICHHWTTEHYYNPLLCELGNICWRCNDFVSGKVDVPDPLIEKLEEYVALWRWRLVKARRRNDRRYARANLARLARCIAAVNEYSNIPWSSLPFDPDQWPTPWKEWSFPVSEEEVAGAGRGHPIRSSDCAVTASSSDLSKTAPGRRVVIVEH
jgi:hypothetical protein